MNTNEFDTDVVVVGTGPMGGTAALALATYGVRVHVVSKWNWVANSPRAHVLNQRAIEVLRDLGVEQEAKAKATPWEQMGDTIFTTSFGGPGDRPAADLGDRRRPARRVRPGQPMPPARPHPAADGTDPGEQRRRTRRPVRVQHRIPAPRPGRQWRHRHPAEPGHRRRLHPAGQVPRRRRRRPVPDRRGHRPGDLRSSTPEPARSTPGSTPT